MPHRSLHVDDVLYQYLMDQSIREHPAQVALRAATASHPHAGMQIGPDQGQFMALLVKLLGERRAIEGGVQVFRIAAVVAVARARVEQRVTGEQRRLLGVGAQADVAHGVAGRVHAFELDGLADLDHVAGLDAAIHAGNARAGTVMRDHLGPGRGDDGRIAAGMVVVLVRVENLRDLPALRLGGGQAFLVVQGVDRERLAALGACDQVVVVAVGVAGPDALDDHRWLREVKSPL